MPEPNECSANRSYLEESLGRSRREHKLGRGRGMDGRGRGRRGGKAWVEKRSLIPRWGQCPPPPELQRRLASQGRKGGACALEGREGPRGGRPRGRE